MPYWAYHGYPSPQVAYDDLCATLHEKYPEYALAVFAPGLRYLVGVVIT